MNDKLEMSVERFAEAVAKENARLISGPGGIMEMKQTIADKEKRIEALEAALRYVDTAIYIDDCGDCRLFSDFNWSMIAAALTEEKKDD